MAQYIYTMNRVAKVVPAKRFIIKDISLSFFPGAKIGVLGLNGSGKSTLLRIMAGMDKDFEGEARPQPGIKIGYLPQEPELDASKDVRGNVEDGVAETKALVDPISEAQRDKRDLHPARAAARRRRPGSRSTQERLRGQAADR